VWRPPISQAAAGWGLECRPCKLPVTQATHLWEYCNGWRFPTLAAALKVPGDDGLTREGLWRLIRAELHANEGQGRGLDSLSGVRESGSPGVRESGSGSPGVREGPRLALLRLPRAAGAADVLAPLELVHDQRCARRGNIGLPDADKSGAYLFQYKVVPLLLAKSGFLLAAICMLGALAFRLTTLLHLDFPVSGAFYAVLQIAFALCGFVRADVVFLPHRRATAARAEPPNARVHL
jgi:hypothetical protein